MNTTKRIRHIFTVGMLLLAALLYKTNIASANSFDINLDANSATYTITEATQESVTFGALNTTGAIYTNEKPDTFIVKNETDKVLQIGMWAATESEVVLNWFGETGPLLTRQSFGRSATAIFTGTYVYPGKETHVQYAYFKEENQNQEKKVRLQVIARITPTDKKVYDNIIVKKPTISVTKIASDKVGIKVDVNNGGAGVRGVSQMEVYCGSKKIKTLKSQAKDEYLFTYKAKGAGSKKYKVKLTAVANAEDTQTSDEASPKANVWTQKVSTKLKDYEDFDTGYVIKSLSYKGKTLIVKGYTYNTMGASVKDYIHARAGYTGVSLFEYFKIRKIPKGIHSYTIKVKNAKVVDLRNINIVVV